ncbi:dihydroorotase [bacterium]|nr:dihydroorotase [bacterium]
MKQNITEAGTVIDLQGKALIPSGVDAQVHLRVPGQSHKETAETGLLAALKGGYSAILTMPNTNPTIDSVEVLRQGQREVLPYEEKFGVKVLWSAAITKNLNSNQSTDLESLVNAGASAFTNDGLGVQDDESMSTAFSRLQELTVPLLQHAEFLGHGGSMAPGPIQRKLNANPYPEEPEWKMVERDLKILRNFPKARYHVLHVSSARTIDLVREAKREGLQVTAEVSPHHLFFNTDTIDAENLSFKMNPPIRSPSDQEALWQALTDGTIDFVATDHAPHETSKKSGSVEDAAFGTLGLETTLRVLLDRWMSGFLSPQRLVEVFSKRPAEFLSLPKAFGDFKIGYEFHGVLVDTQAPARPFLVKEISSLSKNSCFTSANLPGQLTSAFHGERIFEFE